MDYKCDSYLDMRLIKNFKVIFVWISYSAVYKNGLYPVMIGCKSHYSLIEMGACISEDITVEQPEETHESIAGQQRSLVEFVRALSAPSVINDLYSETTSRTIYSIEELTPSQEEFLSKYKMRVYGCQSDLTRKYSTFNIIENEFYNRFHKQIYRETLYELYGLT